MFQLNIEQAGPKTGIIITFKNIPELLLWDDKEVCFHTWSLDNLIRSLIT